MRNVALEEQAIDLVLAKAKVTEQKAKFDEDHESTSCKLRFDICLSGSFNGSSIIVRAIFILEPSYLKALHC